MPRRERRPPKDFAFDFTADWRPYAAIPPGSPACEGWELCGTVIRDGSTYGLAAFAGRFAACTPQGLIFELSAVERSRVALAVEFQAQPGWDTVPKCKVDYYGF